MNMIIFQPTLFDDNTAYRMKYNIRRGIATLIGGMCGLSHFLVFILI